MQATPAGMSPPAEASSGQAGPFGALHGWAMIWTLLGIFVGGMALNLTPCVYPLIPITISYFGGRSGDEAGNGKTMIHALSYVAGIAVTNSLLGMFAAFTGGLMGALLQHPAVLIIIALLMSALALSLFGFWELRVPYGIMQAATRSRTGYLGTLFMGLVMGVVAAPCIGPFVLGLLTWVAGMGSPWLGFIVFFTLSLGLGLPFFFLALFSGNINRLPRSGEWMLWVRKLMGWVLMGMAVHFLQSLVPETVHTALASGTALAAAVHLGWIDRTKAAFRGFEWIKLALSLGAMVFGISILGSLIFKGPGMVFHDYDDTLLASAGEAGLPVLIDFSAQWCSPCREMDEKTFRDSRVRNLVQKEFLPIKVDLTRKGNPIHEKLLQSFHIKGVPTVVFLDGDGKEIKGLRLVDYEPPGPFLERLNKAGRQEK